jgi:hypothetical protein
MSFHLLFGLLAKGESLIFVHDFKGGPLIIKPYSRGGPRKIIQLKIQFLQPPTHTLWLVPKVHILADHV